MRFIRSVCFECGEHIAWSGTWTDKPICPSCGKEPDREALKTTERKRDKRVREHFAKKQIQWEERSPEQDRAYGEGRVAYAKAKAYRFTTDKDEYLANPYTKMKRRARGESEEDPLRLHIWWGQGWYAIIEEYKDGLDERSLT